MWDKSVEQMLLAMRVKSLEDIPVYDLSERYGWRFYQPGDEQDWARMWASAEECDDVERLMESFRGSFHEGEPMDERMIFLTDNGVPFGTATAWYTKEGGPDAAEGLLHWICVDQAHQGQGLSKVLISMVMRRARELGHKSAYLVTQTPCWVAIRMYNRFGFRPVIREERELRGWKIVSEKSGVDFMKMIEEDKE